MSTTTLEDIQNQPNALRGTAQFHLGEGRPALLRAAALLRNSKQIICSGMGASLFAAMPFEYVFSERGVPISIMESSELLYYLSGMLTRDTTVVLVSRSGESIEVVKLLPILRERGCKVISVVNGPTSTLAREADETILIHSPAEGLIAIQAYTTTLAVLCLLAAACFDELDVAGSELRETAAAAEALLKSCPLLQPASTPFERGFIYVLGRGASLASVHEGALLMHEMARLPAVGMSSAQFRHGPVEVVSKDFQAIVFGSERATAELDLKLAEDLSKAAKAVRWIGPAMQNASVPALCPLPASIPARFASVVEIIPVQLVAWHLAQAGGIQPGKFRYAAPVTLSETSFEGSQQK